MKKYSTKFLWIILSMLLIFIVIFIVWITSRDAPISTMPPINTAVVTSDITPPAIPKFPEPAIVNHYSGLVMTIDKVNQLMEISTERGMKTIFVSELTITTNRVLSTESERRNMTQEELTNVYDKEFPANLSDIAIGDHITAESSENIRGLESFNADRITIRYSN